MFDENQIKAYHNIKAPARIYNRLNGKGYSLKVLAACLVCVIMLGIFLMPGDAKIKINGQTIENSIVISEGKARSTEIEVPIELENIDKKTEITASEGKILFDGCICDDASIIIEDDATVLWTVEKDNLPCEISISDKNGVKSFTLIYENSKYILRRNEK